VFAHTYAYRHTLEETTLVYEKNGRLDVLKQECCCSVLQCSAVLLQCSAVCCRVSRAYAQIHTHTRKHTQSLCCVEVRRRQHCNTLQHTATHCNTLRPALQHRITVPCPSEAEMTLQHTATHCNSLQPTATHCNTLQHTATHCNPLQPTATPCNTHCNTES